MKFIDGFQLKTVMGQYIIVSDNADQVDFNRLIAFNDSAAFLWEKMEGKDFSEEDLTQVLLENYEIDRETAKQDAIETLEQWQSLGLICE